MVDMSRFIESLLFSTNPNLLPEDTLNNPLNNQKPVPFKALYEYSCKWVYSIMNIFSALRVYASKWQEKKVESFKAEEIALVDKAEVVESQYGLSVCFFLKAGGQSYIPLDQNSSAAIGDTIDLNKAQVVTLCKQGENDIYRVRI